MRQPWNRETALAYTKSMQVYAGTENAPFNQAAPLQAKPSFGTQRQGTNLGDKQQWDFSQTPAGQSDAQGLTDEEHLDLRDSTVAENQTAQKDDDGEEAAAGDTGGTQDWDVKLTHRDARHSDTLTRRDPAALQPRRDFLKEASQGLHAAFDKFGLGVGYTWNDLRRR